MRILRRYVQRHFEASAVPMPPSVRPTPTLWCQLPLDRLTFDPDSAGWERPQPARWDSSRDSLQRGVNFGSMSAAGLDTLKLRLKRLDFHLGRKINGVGNDL